MCTLKIYEKNIINPTEANFVYFNDTQTPLLCSGIHHAPLFRSKLPNTTRITASSVFRPLYMVMISQ